MSIQAPRNLADLQIQSWLSAAQPLSIPPEFAQAALMQVMALAYRDAMMGAMMSGAFGPGVRPWSAPEQSLPYVPGDMDDQLRALRAMANAVRGQGGPARAQSYAQGPSFADVRSGAAAIQRGHSGAEVRQIQRALNAAGIKPPLAEDGLFGPKTQAAVRNFQKQQGVTPTGAVDAALLGKIGASEPSSESSGPANRRSSNEPVSNGPANRREPVSNGPAQTAQVGPYDGKRPAEGTVENRRSFENHPPLTNGEGQRSRESYDQVVNQFAVGNNSRYAIRDGSTYCNIFAWDVTRAMGAEIPHWVKRDGSPAKPYEKGAHELNANDTEKWLNKHGAEHGWKKVSAEEAQRNANDGKPSVVIMAKEGGIGHVAVVRPGEVTDKGPAIAQAGARNFNEGHVHDVWRKSAPVQYWVHE